MQQTDRTPSPLVEEDLLAQLTKNALATPFNIERLLNTADAEYSGKLQIFCCPRLGQ